MNESIRDVHCFFEQSGTFKNEFIKLGFHAYDYDLLNDFGETDFVIDLFHEIEMAFDNKSSIFDKIDSQDLIIAFFPCVRFEDQILMHFHGDAFQVKDFSLRQKMLYDMQLLSETKRYYDLVNKLFIVCIDRYLRLILENPYSQQHFLKRYWCYSPVIIDKDRCDDGDYFKKPTQYWFLNFEPYYNFLLDPIEYNFIPGKNVIATLKKEQFYHLGASNKTIARSMIHPTYANRFIRRYLLPERKVFECD